MVAKVINPAMKYPNGRHSGESRNPSDYWLPEQVRHDKVGAFHCRVNNDVNS